MNLIMACRVVGNTGEGYEEAKTTVLPMRRSPDDDAQAARRSLPVMLTKGGPAKGDANKGLIGDFHERSVKRRLLD